MSQFRRSAYILAAIVAIVTVVAASWKVAPPQKFVGLTGIDIPQQVGGFTNIENREIDPITRGALASADITSRLYNSNGGIPIDFTIIGGTDRSALHDPRACLIGAGWGLQNDHLVPLANSDVVAHACIAVDSANKARQSMVYLYVVDGKIVNQVTEIRWQMMLSALLGQKNRPVYFVRFIQDIPGGAENDAASEKRLLVFASAMWNKLGPSLISAGQRVAKN